MVILKMEGQQSKHQILHKQARNLVLKVFNVSCRKQTVVVSFTLQLSSSALLVWPCGCLCKGLYSTSE